MAAVASALPSSRVNGPRAGDEELHGGRGGNPGGRERLGSGRGGLRQRQRSNREPLLARDVQQRATGDEEDQTGAARQEHREVGGAGAYLLEVVQHQQQAFLAQGVGEHLGRGARGILPQAEGSRDRREDQVGGGDGGERDEDHAFWERRRQLLGDAQGQPRLADPARTGQGDEADTLVHDQIAHRRDVGLAADK
jgi:hypothetical protein